MKETNLPNPSASFIDEADEVIKFLAPKPSDEAVHEVGESNPDPLAKFPPVAFVATAKGVPALLSVN